MNASTGCRATSAVSSIGILEDVEEFITEPPEISDVVVLKLIPKSRAR
jgi:hypothetical protein